MKLLQHDGEHRTQDEAITHHNERKEIMLSMAHLWQIVQENNTEAINALRKDFDDYWIVTSTRIIYSKNNLSAKVIHNFGSTMTKQKEIEVREVPTCDPTYLEELLETNAGLDYLRALTGQAKATKEQLAKFFVTLSGKQEKDIRFWTPTKFFRKTRHVRSVQLYFYDGRFCVGGFSWIDGDYGLSRGVIVTSAKQTKFFSNKAVFDTQEKTITIPMQRTLRKDIEKRMRNKRPVKISWNLKVRLK